MKNFLTAVLLFISLAVVAQETDPVLMRINGKEIRRSEFEYSLNKNNMVSAQDQKAIDDYLPMFIDFKRKVAEAEAQKLDTLASFREELAANRKLLAEPYLTDDDYIEKEAHRIYSKDSATIGLTGFVKVTHIFKPVKQQDSEEAIAKTVATMDSAYAALQAGASFADVAKAVGVPAAVLKPFEFVKGQAYKEFEEVAYSLADSAYSKPFRSPSGYHIVMRLSSRPFGQFADYHDALLKMLEKKGIRNAARKAKGAQLAKEMGGNLAPEQALAREDSLLETKYPEFRNLMTEYHDGLLFFEISTREVWDKASKDEAGLNKFFKKNRKNYKFETPRFRGAVIYANSQADVNKAKSLLKDAPLDEYKDILKNNFYIDSVFTVRLEMGVFTIGSNGWVDKLVFEQGEGGNKKPGFELVDVAGNIIAEPQSIEDVRGLVVSDYQKHIEEKWLNSLRKKYKADVDPEVLKTVNNHK